MPAAPKDRGAEQGDVDGPLECSLTLGVVASKARQQEVHARQRRGELPWIAASVDAVTAAGDEFDKRAQLTATWAATPPARRREAVGHKAIVPDPSLEVQTLGGLADFWYLDDGDILCVPGLVVVYLQAFDEIDKTAGATRNLFKTEVF